MFEIILLHEVYKGWRYTTREQDKKLLLGSILLNGGRFAKLA